jgi:hypothetical protein
MKVRALTGVGLAAVITCMAGAASAQNLAPVGGQEKSPQQIAKERATEQAYKDSLKQIPDKEDKDPWGTVRSSGSSSSTAAKPKAPKATARRTNTAGANTAGTTPAAQSTQ